jgi:hypothetical protein
MNGYKFNTIAEVNNAIQTINNANNFIPIEGNVTQTLVVASQHTYNEESFYVIRFDEYSDVLGLPTEILVD